MTLLLTRYLHAGRVGAVFGLITFALPTGIESKAYAAADPAFQHCAAFIADEVRERWR
jgi:hypothetical protein